MHENQGQCYEYSSPISVVMTSAGNQNTQIPSPFGMESEYLVEYIVLTTADASVFISADNTMTTIPTSGETRGYLASGICQISPKEIWSNCDQFVSINAIVGATNSAISICLRFRRPLVVEIPQDVHRPNPHFTED